MWMNEVMLQLRRQPAPLVHLTANASASYSHHKATALKDASWNDGRLLAVGRTCRQFHKYRHA